MKKISCVVALAILFLVFSLMGARAEKSAPIVERESSTVSDVHDYINSMQYTSNRGITLDW
jgi:outer membrane lipoprotein-sorting protein